MSFDFSGLNPILCLIAPIPLVFLRSDPILILLPLIKNGPIFSPLTH